MTDFLFEKCFFTNVKRHFSLMLLLTRKHVALFFFFFFRFVTVGGVEEAEAEWLGRWACNLMVPGSSPPPCNSLDLFSVVPSSTPWQRFVNSQLVCLLPVGIFNHFMFIYNICFPVCLYWP